MPNQTPPELEAQILGMTREYPTTSYVKIADQLKLIGVPATANQVRGVWLRQLTDPEQHLEAPALGYLGCQDTYFVGTLKGVGRICAQRSR